MSLPRRICLVPRIPGVAGPAGFQRRLAEGLTARGVEVCFDLQQDPGDAVLVVGGTRHLAGLRRAQRRGVRVVQRLNGMNWIHRRRFTGLRHFLRAEVNNLILRRVRRMADAVVYQSHFAREWWEREHGPAPGPAFVVHNGVPLDLYTPHGPERPPQDVTRMLMVEGNLAGGYEIGLESGVGLVRRLRSRGWDAELAVAGRAPAAIQRRWEGSDVPIRWMGLVPSDRIPALDRSAHLLYAADLNPACPNSVIEALACGLPVVAFDTGALPELVSREAGAVVPYGGDPWRLDPPDLESLAEAAEAVLRAQERCRLGARARAEAHFGLDRMVEGYLEALG